MKILSDDDFVSLVQQEAIKTASELESSYLELHELKRKGIKIVREVELLNQILEHHGEKGIDIKSIIK